MTITPTTPVRAAAYVRISRDRIGAGLGVDRQEADCRELAERLGWTIATVHRDNDLSAYSGKPRPGYRALLHGIAAGHIDAVLAWHTDRLHRSPVELESYIDACEGRGIPTNTVKAGHIDLATPSGRMVARMLGATARYEVEHMVERQKRAKLQAATDGQWRGGRRPFGYGPDGVTIVPDEAVEVLAASRAVLTGVSLRRIARDLNDRGVVTSTGRQWQQDTVRKVLLRPRNAGFIDHVGEIVGVAAWPAIVPEDMWRGVVAAISDPARRTQFSSVRRWMGSGLYRCYCGQTVKPFLFSKRADVRPAYSCRASKHLTRTAEEVDDLVTDVVVGWLSKPESADLLAGPAATDVADLHVRAAGLRAQLDELAAMYARHTITASQLETGTEDLRRQLGEIDMQIADSTRGNVLEGLVGVADPAAAWKAIDLDRRRAVISRLFTVVLLPGKRGRPKGWEPGHSYFDPETVRFDWKV